MIRFTAFLASLLFAGAVAAQAYPNKPVRVVVPWPPGQATDIAARIIAERLQSSLGQAFVIENKPGAGGAIGTDAVAKSPGDGYTLLAASSGPISIMPNLQKTPYDPLKDLAPVAVTCTNSFALVTRPDFPANSAKEFVALLKANPDKYSFSSSGTGATAHLIAELFNHMAGIKARHVPYKGSAPAITDGQRTDRLHARDRGIDLPHVRSGRLKLLGLSAASGSPLSPTRLRSPRPPTSWLRHRRVDRLCGAGRHATRHPRAPFGRNAEGPQDGRDEAADDQRRPRRGVQHARGNGGVHAARSGALRQHHPQRQHQDRPLEPRL
jgi:tripartite-type tricarboxylate transporter receptor subunit TctC